jgi:phosphatidate phosphatase PAH1
MKNRSVKLSVALLAGLLVGLVGVGSASAQTSTNEASTSEKSTNKLDLVDHSACEYPAGFPTLPEVEWRHSRSELIAKMGDPRHFARDAVTSTGTLVSLHAKFTHGKTSKDIEDEKVRVLVQSCDGWTAAGGALTDDDGWISVDFTSPKEPGIYRVLFQLEPSGNYVTSRLWVVPKGTKVAVFDIDGTLTTGDDEVFRDVADEVVDDGDYEAEAYPGGRELVQYYANQGYLVMYLTGRPYWLKENTKAWLAARGLADGTLRLTPTHSDFLPSESGVGEFKRAELEAVANSGLILDVAHGNATTDISAYLGAGIAKDRVWIIGKHAGSEGTHAVEESWTSLLERLRTQ